ncbi:hypothetical protein HmCmsJML254_00383 [Escherichia coli]|nr:DUF932 domain-containing protein [Escherichia coli]EFU2706702.1 DUF932 domain-containing protein [Escherichia coli]GDC90539.1 hypothetical protein HmCmsJML254_00383 [Escherichia coli]VED11773.1 antirestriction protein [Escherichia coli]
MRLASRFGYANQIRRDRPLTHEELMHYVPGIFGEDKHTSRSQNYTYIPTITVLESLQREGFQPFFACQTRVRDPGRRGYTKHMLRLRRAGEISLCRLSIQAMASGHPSVTGTVTRTAVRNFSRISFIPDITGSSRSVMNVMLPAPDLYSLSFIHITRISYMKTLSQNTTSSACAPETDLQQLVATLVPDEQRISFWPQHFGLIPQWVTLEPRVFGWMDRLCEDYCGGIWNLYTLNNGGAFMAPEPDDDDDETWVLFNAMNGNRAEMSPEAAGIAACLMTYSHHACRTECYAMTVHYYRLRDYALQHPECSAIMRIID